MWLFPKLENWLYLACGVAVGLLYNDSITSESTAWLLCYVLNLLWIYAAIYAWQHKQIDEETAIPALFGLGVIGMLCLYMLISLPYVAYIGYLKLERLL